MGRRVGDQLRAQAAGGGRAWRSAWRALAQLMTDLGYHARATEGVAPLPPIEAGNCVFHHLAAQYPEVCRFDLALLAAFVGARRRAPGVRGARRPVSAASASRLRPVIRAPLRGEPDASAAGAALSTQQCGGVRCGWAFDRAPA
ncbi:MAG: hypothetical protein MZW92_15430 [Comamonadaceae bacterium]|nr:hypothetical protein [Comamonadaceae bacterium]